MIERFPEDDARLSRNDWLNDRERHWIGFFKDRGDRLTNATDGGLGILGYRHTDEAKRKIGEHRNFLGKTHSEESREKIGNASRKAQLDGGFRKGRTHSLETRIRLAAAQLGSKRPAQSGGGHWTARTGRSPNEGREFSAEWRANISAAQIGKTYPNRRGQRVRELTSGLEFGQAVQAAAHFGLSKSTVSRCVRDGLERQGLRFQAID